MGRANSSNNLWRTFAFNGQFVNPSGANGTAPYNTTVAGVFDIVALGYRYVPPLVSCGRTIAGGHQGDQPGEAVAIGEL